MQEQGRITHDLVNTARIYRRVYDAYLWNRLDAESSLTEKLIKEFSLLYKTQGDLEREKLLRQAVEKVRPLLDESTTMGTLTLILDLFLKTAYERSPAIKKLVGRASQETDPGKQLKSLESALKEQRLLRQDLILLADRLQAWEDFLGILQGFQDALDMQEGIRSKIEKLTNKK